MSEKRYKHLMKFLQENITQVILGAMTLLVIGFLNYVPQIQKNLLEDALLSKGKGIATSGAHITEYILEEAIKTGVFTESQVFDTDYQIIPNTDPPKYHTAYDAYLDLKLQDLEDQFLLDGDVSYAAAVDINGYVPTHNRVFSQPLTGDYEIDLVNNRTKRIFDDEVAKNAAQNVQSHLIQYYLRDTGEELWDISTPIHVNGKHWGNFRVGISLAYINALLAKSILRILAPGVLLIIGMLVVTYLISRLNGRLRRLNDGLNIEIDQRVILQNALANENEFLSITLMSMGESVITTDEKDLITTFNNASEKLTGFSADEAIGTPLDQIFQISDHHLGENKSSNIDYLIRHTKEFNVLTLVKKDGDKVLVSCELFPLKAIGESGNGYVILCKDITEIYKVEEETKLSQKMEAIGRLAAGIAHEINTPIQYVGDNINYLKRVFTRYAEVLNYAHQYVKTHKDKPSTDEDINQFDVLWTQNKIEHYFQEVPNAIDESLSGIERVRKIILAIREFSHPSQKEKKLADINRGIETTVTISRNEWKYVANIELDLDENLPLVPCKIDEVNQVILNMIVNAAQAIQQALPEGSSEKGIIRITTQKRDNLAVITVQDTGCGIPEDIRNRIFEPFFTTKAITQGTGQGLAIAHNIIVKNHNGRITVDSEEGKGTIFTIELPIES